MTKPLFRLSCAVDSDGQTVTARFNRAIHGLTERKLSGVGMTLGGDFTTWAGPAELLEEVKEIVDQALWIDNKQRQKPMLCWDCSNSALGITSPCPWAARFRPVPGWLTNDGRVVACPLFNRDSRNYGSKMVKG